MRRVGRAVAALAIVAAVVLAPLSSSSAGAAGFKKPVDPYPDLPSAQYKVWVHTSTGPTPLKNYTPGSIGWEENRANVRAFLASKGYPDPSAVSAGKNALVKSGTLANTAAAPRTLSMPASFAKVGGGVMFGLTAGWGLGQAGLAMWASATGADYNALICNQGPVYGMVNAVMTFDLGDNCTVPVTNPNSDASPGYKVGPITIRAEWGSWTNSSMTTQIDVYCRRGVLPAGQTLERTGTAAVSGTTGGLRWGANDCRTAEYGGDNYILPITGTIQYRIMQGSTVVATSSALSTNPVRRPYCEIVWDDNTVTGGVGLQYRDPDGMPMSPAGNGCQGAAAAKPGTHVPKKITVGTQDATGGNVKVSEQTMPEFTEEELQALRDTTGKGLELFKGKKSCLTWEADCSGWWEATEKGASTTTDYRCTFGGKTVALTQCYVYKETFEDQTGTEDLTITDPGTGDERVWSGDETGNSTDPSTGPTPGDQCMASWGSVANPVEWVFHPVRCAFVWALAPRVTVVDAKWGQANQKWGQTMPGMIGGIAGAVFVVDPITGCQGPHIAMPFSTFWEGWVDVDWYPLSACAEPAASIAATSRVISGAVLVFLTALGIIRRASATVNAPGVGA